MYRSRMLIVGRSPFVPHLLAVLPPCTIRPRR
jgi:hypothetical protein